jgi:hypothetical protein
LGAKRLRMMRLAITTLATSCSEPPLASGMLIVSLNDASVNTTTTRAASLR